jgi:hypothetical protein
MTGTTSAETVGASAGASVSELETDEKKEVEYEARLATLPEEYREEVLRQYDLPASKATVLSILSFATWLEIFLMVAGTILSIGAGTFF